MYMVIQWVIIIQIYGNTVGTNNICYMVIQWVIII